MRPKIVNIFFFFIIYSHWTSSKYSALLRSKDQNDVIINFETWCHASISFYFGTFSWNFIDSFSLYWVKLDILGMLFFVSLFLFTKKTHQKVWKIICTILNHLVSGWADVPVGLEIMTIDNHTISRKHAASDPLTSTLLFNS